MMKRETETTARAPRGTARRRLLEAAVEVVRTRGYHATTVDDLCAAAGVTKGAFFHHFDSKSDLAVAAAEHWSTTTGELFASAPFNEAQTPMERSLAYLDFRASLITGPPESFTCLVGTMAQEVFATDPEIRDACAASILGHAATLEADLDAALTETARAEGITGRSLARHTQVVLQGAFVLAKAADDPTIVIDSIAHLRRYLIGLLRPPIS